MTRYETVYLIVTILKTKNTFKLRKFLPKSLAANEVALKFKLELDTNEWFKRVKEVQLGKISPPEILQARDMSIIIRKSTPNLVMDRLVGRDDNQYEERKL